MAESKCGSLAEALAAFGLELPAEQTAALENYCRLLWDWNTRINLTRHDDFEKFVTRDLLDTMAFSRALKPKERVLDVGTGGGVPGVVLTVLRPDLHVTLSESIGKKVRVVTDIVEKMGLRAEMFHGRAEDAIQRRRYDVLIVRAVARLAKLLEWFKPYWNRFDRLLVLKGPSWVDERGEARHLGLLKDISLRKIDAYRTPGTDAESVLLQVKPKDRDSEHIEEQQ